MFKVFAVMCCIFLAGCAGGMKAVSSDQRETLSISYLDGISSRDITAVSSTGETFSGTLVWIKDAGSSGRYRGALMGDKGRTLEVLMECNTFTGKCVSTARDTIGLAFYVQ